MATLDFEGTRVEVRAGDTVASALYRAGVRTFTRSIKYHRRRGLYCLTGDCPNCLLTVDGEPGVRSCCADASAGQVVVRESGWPSAELDLLSVADHLHPLLPVGFYYKVFARPRWLWPLAERAIRRTTGIGSLPLGEPAAPKPVAHVRCDVLVIGAGVAGLSAALGAGRTGKHVVAVDEGRVGEKIAPGRAREAVDALAAELKGHANVDVLECHTAIGLYEGPLVPIVGPDELLEVEPERIVVATGAVEAHRAFPGNDLPGVWLGRGAARMAGVHGIRPGRIAVVVATDREGLEHARTLRGAGVNVEEVLLSDALADDVAPDLPVTRDGRLARAEGKRHLTGVVVGSAEGERRVACDVLVLSLGKAPRDALLRMGADLSMGSPAVGAGEVVAPGCTLEEAALSGERAARGLQNEPREPKPAGLGHDGFVCLCEDVGSRDLEAAWREGWTSSEILKRYTTATMGPCQGALCGRHLAAFAASRSDRPEIKGTRTTSRPPVRPVRLEDVAGGVNEVIEKQTSLHDTHLTAGARLDWSGSWMRPYHYGDVAAEYRAVRERVSVMDIGTLGKFLIGGRDARTLVDRVFACRIDDLAPGRSRYLLALDEAGYVMDDGLISAVDDARFYLTTTSGGADRMEAWLRDWSDRWELHAHIVNQTSMLGAINVAGPLARELLTRLTPDDLDRSSFPYSSHREIVVAGVPCRALRVGFVGELSFELHHARSRGPALWSALIRQGADLGIRPHGLDALDALRLEKGHVFLGQDTLPDDHPAKLGLGWSVAHEKSSFVGKVALERMAELPLERKLVGLRFDTEPQRGAPLTVEGDIVGRITSCTRSPALGYPVGLAWLRAREGSFPTKVRANGTTAIVVPTPFYDPEGERLRA